MNRKNEHSRLVVVGAGPIGMYLARRIAEYRSVLILDANTDSPEATQGRAQLLHQLSHGLDTLASQHNPALPTNIECRSGRRVAGIDRAGRTLLTEQGERIEYDHLVLALGASPLVPPFEGRGLRNVQTAYSRRQIQMIACSATRAESIAIVGGGLLAVELAASIAASAQATLLVREHLLRTYAEPAIGSRVANHLRTLGVAVEQGCEVAQIVGAFRACGVRLSDGQLFKADRVVLACGTRANTDLAYKAGLPAQEGILVDEAMRTADPHVFAVGDCAQPPDGAGRGNVARGIFQAERAIAALLDLAVPVVSESDSLSKRRIRLGQLEFLCMTQERNRVKTPARRINRRLGSRAFSVTLQDSRIVGYQALLPPRQAERLADLAEAPVAIHRRIRLMLELGMVPRAAAPSDPIVCDCAGVSRRRVLQLVAAYGANPAAVSRASGAGLYCGGCADTLSALVEGKRRGLSWPAVTASTLVLGVVTFAAWLPVAGPGQSVTTLWFQAYALLMTNGMRQASGYVSVAFMVLALGLISPRRSQNPTRSRWLHVLYGTLALAVLPLHVLGGMDVGAGSNRVLVEIFLVCVLLGVFVLLKRSLRQVLWLHSAATVVLLAAIAIHVVDIYQY